MGETVNLYLDVTGFSTGVPTSGVRRVVSELCKRLPRAGVIPICLSPAGYILLDSSYLEKLVSLFTNSLDTDFAEGALNSPELSRMTDFLPTDRILVPDFFSDQNRIAFFSNMSDSNFELFRFIVYDLFPLTHPEFYPTDVSDDYNYGYFRILRRSNSCGFVSQSTRDAYYGRLRRTAQNGGRVLTLGCDSLGSRPTTSLYDRPLTFTIFGNMEARKHRRLTLDVFESMIRRLPEVRLIYAAPIESIDVELRQRIVKLATANRSNFVFYSEPFDNRLRQLVAQSRATIHLSAAEGFGLPPVESLWLGTPVIASSHIPSLDGLATKGISYVEPLDEINLARAVLQFLDNTYANQKVNEALSLSLCTWQQFAEQVLRWWSGSNPDAQSLYPAGSA